VRSPTIAITHVPSPRIDNGERTYVGQSAIDYPRALDQHARYREVLRDCGADVRLLDANRDFPDSVFVEDTAIVLDEVAIVTPMGTASRRGEPPAIERELRQHRDDVQRIELPATIEGGDVTRVGRTLFVGVSTRTNARGIESLAAVAGRFGYRTVPVRIHECLHLKSACTVLPDQRLLVNPEWLELRDLQRVSMLAVPAEEPRAADVLSIHDMVCVAAAFPRTAELLDKLGFEVRPVDLSEFAKAEGGVTCLSLVFEASAAA